MTDPIADLSSMIAKAWRCPPSCSGEHTAELCDESDPDGLVAIRHSDGNPFAWMPRAAWEKFRAAGKAKP